ncbi:helix-turn-helix transcriptional regulator [Marinobacter salinisoli]|uniref:Helix-turn-helix transcriptional regulator n=1 Tax=Marinobacter salinisoli TaxID=2769486 RepID=A0ABX7MR73_9GAMM|nr:helix-turn-helix transcriptional regulator [Marinobacter salinisoli]QSP94007.1 helix-turn-helix transcriptional regulator [Marinobacter salinisoli]
MPKMPRALKGVDRLKAHLKLKHRIDHRELSLGDSIRELRKIDGLTQTELAKRAKLSKTTISKIENDDDSVTIGLFRRALHALGYSLAAMSTKPLEIDKSEKIDKNDERYLRMKDFEFWKQHVITLDDLPYLFPENDDEDDRPNEW